MLLFVKLDHFKEMLQPCDIILSFIMKTTTQYQSHLNLDQSSKMYSIKILQNDTEKVACL